MQSKRQTDFYEYSSYKTPVSILIRLLGIRDDVQKHATPLWTLYGCTFQTQPSRLEIDQEPSMEEQKIDSKLK